MGKPSIHEDPDRTTYWGLFTYGCLYFRAAKAAHRELDSNSGHLEWAASVPVLFLLGQTAELALKAFLVYKGVTLRSVRLDYGHELKKCLKKSKELGLTWSNSLSSNDEQVLAILDELYSTKQLQYIVTGFITSARYSAVEPLIVGLLQSVGKAIGAPTVHLQSIAVSTQ
jgi:hypothetical protein